MYACVDSGAIPNDKPPIAGAPPASCPAFECYKVYIERKDVSLKQTRHTARAARTAYICTSWSTSLRRTAREVCTVIVL